MQETSQLFADILAIPNHKKEWKAIVFNGETGTEYEKENIVSIEINNQLYGNALIGNACSGVLDLVLHGVPSASIPKMAKIKIEMRLVANVFSPSPTTIESEWIPMGTYWVNTRSENPYSETITLSCVDGMMFGEREFFLEDGPDEKITYDWDGSSGNIIRIAASKTQHVDIVQVSDIVYEREDFIGQNIVISYPDGTEVTKKIVASNFNPWTFYGVTVAYVYSDPEIEAHMDAVDSGLFMIINQNVPYGQVTLSAGLWMGSNTSGIDVWFAKKLNLCIVDTSWDNKPMRSVAQLCSTKMGIPLEDATQFQNDPPYRLTAPPEGYTVRQVLSGIAAAHGGNVIITKDNKIRFVPFVPTDTHVDLQLSISDFSLAKQYSTFGQVVFNFEGIDGETLTVLYPDVDDPNGPVIEVTVNAITNSDDARTIVEAVYNSLENYLYSPYSAQDAVLNPAMELGDGLTVNSVYSVLANAKETCDGLYTVTIGAPSFEETEYEFKYKGQSDRNITRKIAKSSSSLRISIDGIEAMVSGLAPDWAEDTSYSVGDLVSHNGLYYTCIEGHVSSSSFDSSKWSEGTEQATLQNSIKLNLNNGLVLTSSAGSDTNSCYIQLQYGDIVLFGRDIIMNNVTAERLAAQTINAEDISLAGALSCYGSLEYPGYKSRFEYKAGDRIYDRLPPLNPLHGSYTEGVWECTVSHTSYDSFFQDYWFVSTHPWTLIEDPQPEEGGFIGFGKGAISGGIQTAGAMLSSRELSGGKRNYVITTTAGVRIQNEDSSWYMTNGKAFIDSPLLLARGKNYGTVEERNALTPSNGQIFWVVDGS